MRSRHFLISIFILLSSFGYSQKKHKPFTFFILGDMPYTIPDDFVKFENVIAKINEQNQEFNVFVGDFKSSKTPCSNEAYQKILHYFNSFKKPLIYTPGDNEWTDCNTVKAGSYNSEERLSQLRICFYNDTLHSLGKIKLELKSESTYPKYHKFVENKMWNLNGVSFATIHLVGSNNNLNVTKSNEEFNERSNSNIFWLNQLFEKAKKDNSLGIVIFEHADMFTPDKGSDGFNTFIAALESLMRNYKKPVLLINGDSHEFKVDKPFYKNEDLQKSITNFTRMQVFGEAEMHAVYVKVNPKNPMLFEINQFLID